MEVDTQLDRRVFYTNWHAQRERGATERNQHCDAGRIDCSDLLKVERQESACCARPIECGGHFRAKPR